MTKRILLVLCFALLPASLPAQSLFSTRGLGAPLEGLDARARALGVNGVGLVGLSTTLLNPAEAAGTVRRGVTASFQPWSGSARLNGETGDVGGTRFPLIAALYPIGRTTFTLGFAGLYDQSWGIVTEGEQVLGTDTVDFIDLVNARGGIGQLRFGAAHMFGPRVALGASVGMLTGNLDRSVSRAFPDSTFSLQNFETRQRWDYSAPTASVGARVDLGNAVRLGGSVTWAGTLKAKPRQGSTTTFEYDAPLRVAAGTSILVNSQLVATASMLMSSYGSGSYRAPGGGVNVIASNTMDLGGGLEYAGIRTERRVFPLRAGFRRASLPFHNSQDEQPTEWSGSAGLGLRLAEDDFGPLAVADLAFEKGKREGWEGATSASGLSESFWRFTATISLFGR